MDPHTSLGRLCINDSQIGSLNDMIKSEGDWSGPEYVDTINSGKKKVEKEYTFHRMECDEVCERYITSCFVEGLHPCDGVTDLEYDNNLISNKFVVKLGLTCEVKLLTDGALDGFKAPIYCRSLNATNLREMISPDGRLIVENLDLGVPRFAITRPIRLTFQDISDILGRMEIRQGVLERMSWRRSYHSNK
nr:hypothetical protein [Tanacetum cinerariifolium]